VVRAAPPPRWTPPSLRNSLVISVTLALIFGFLFLVSRLLHNDFVAEATPAYEALLKVKADLESRSVTAAVRAQDVHEAGRLVSQFQVNYPPLTSRNHGLSSRALGNALSCYREACIPSSSSVKIKLRGDKYLAEARKHIDAGY
jgi:hypothetical protein